MLPTVAPLVLQITGVAENEWQRVVVEHAVLDLVDYGPLARRAKARAGARGIRDTFGNAPCTAARRLPALPHAYRLARRARCVYTPGGVCQLYGTHPPSSSPTKRNLARDNVAEARAEADEEVLRRVHEERGEK
jgi:hypothetical protein